MKKLLSLPPNLVNCLHKIEQLNHKKWFFTSDPVGSKLGSGGGTTYLLNECYKNESPSLNFSEWLGQEKRILLHAGGQSRRLPAYAPSGKILTPIPIFRWERGQKLNQNLLSLQLPLYKKMIAQAPESLHTLIASGDVYIRTDKPLAPIPEADIVCYGLWVNPDLAKNHGVFFSKRENSTQLDFMIQKPSIEELSNLAKSHLFLMDIGIWMLSDKAVKLLTQKSKNENTGDLKYYDLYSSFGCSLGNNPTSIDEEINQLSVKILPLEGGEFYHFGTSNELISSTLAIQNIVNDQREIMHHKVKVNPAIFIQNSDVRIKLNSQNSNVWIENSYLSKDWEVSHDNIITGVPKNNWKITLSPTLGIDIIPIGEDKFAIRPFGLSNAFKGSILDKETTYLNITFNEWASARGINPSLIESSSPDTKDIQAAKIFPVLTSLADMEKVLVWMLNNPKDKEGKNIWNNAEKFSADDISNHANLIRLYEQREDFRKKNWTDLAKNYSKSVFYQLDLKYAANEYAKHKLELPQVLDAEENYFSQIHNRMFRAKVFKERGKAYAQEKDKAYQLLREGLIQQIDSHKQTPQLGIYSDQIVWARSPVRIDLAGGWTDTPPYSLLNGGNVINLSIELNGQQPLQVYIKPCETKHIVLKSIDLGASEIVESYEELKDFTKVGSPFSIPKAALCLSGFAPEYCSSQFKTLKEQLNDFGCGIELTLLAAIPAGSGLGTSSILSATVLGAINDFCQLNWDKTEICQRTLLLEQLLTTGGGWQDQYGGIHSGLKLLQTQKGFDQTPLIHWLPEHLFRKEYKNCHLLYYTGITRTAKNILSEIVNNMFLNSSEHLAHLKDMKAHTLEMFDAIQRNNFQAYGELVKKTWEQNKALDAGTNPEAIEYIISLIKDYTLGYKLPGAGGGGYLYMVAKDEQAANMIRKVLTENRPNSRARFVDMKLSQKGLQISRS